MLPTCQVVFSAMALHCGLDAWPLGLAALPGQRLPHSCQLGLQSLGGREEREGPRGVRGGGDEGGGRGQGWQLGRHGVGGDGGAPPSGRVLRLISVVSGTRPEAQRRVSVWAAPGTDGHVFPPGLQASLASSGALTGTRQSCLKSGLSQRIQARLLLFLEPLGLLQRAKRGRGSWAESGSAFPPTRSARLREPSTFLGLDWPLSWVSSASEALF